MADSRGERERHAERTAAAETTASPLLKRRQGLLSSCTPERGREQQLRVTDNSTTFQLRSARFCKFHCCKKSMMPMYLKEQFMMPPHKRHLHMKNQRSYMMASSVLSRYCGGA
jgi:hypothetical protein